MTIRFRTIIILVSFLSLSTVTVSCRQHRRPKKITFKRVSENKRSDDKKWQDVSKTDLSLDYYVPAPLSDKTEQIIQRKAYVLSYNKDTKLPNWVFWHLTSNHVDGVNKRINTYFEDKDVSAPRAVDSDYRGSGWTHGHMCPAGDNKWDKDAMLESNILTNICPQDKQLNSGLWNRIEQDCRKWAQIYGDIYIVCGPLLYNKEHEVIGDNKVVVPEAFFKVILCLKGKPKAIGFVVKNNAGTKMKDQYVNSVDEVERITGIDFFPSLPDDIENIVEARADLHEW